MPYAVFVDEKDKVWLSDFGANALVRFNPTDERFEVFTLPSSEANIRQSWEGLERYGRRVWSRQTGSNYHK
jgi:virginiamycin B lyase